MTVGEAVRQRIIQLCQERDISINKLSSISGVTQSTVNNIVSGRNNIASGIQINRDGYLSGLISNLIVDNTIKIYR